jgi:hypothetical protein
MPAGELVAVSAAIFAIASVYSTVGRAGASAYVAGLTLFGFLAAVIRPISLTPNLPVATIATVQYVRAGPVPWKLFRLFATLSVPLAFLGVTRASRCGGSRCSRWRGSS